MSEPSTSRQPLEPEIIDVRRSGLWSTDDVEHLKLLAKLMDHVFEIPGLKLRFGLDSILGLLPGFGDFATSLVTLYIIQEAHRRGVSRVTLARMGFNVLVDWVVGSVPVAGDAFDVFWKSNRRNVELLLQHEADPKTRARRTVSDWAFLVGLIAVLVTALIGSITVSWLIIAAVGRWLFHAAG